MNKVFFSACSSCHKNDWQSKHNNSPEWVSALPRKHIACVWWFGVPPMCVKSCQLEDTNNLHSVDLTQSMPIPKWKKHFSGSFAQLMSSSVSILPFQTTEGLYEEHKPPLTECFASNLLSSISMSSTTSAAFSFHARAHRGCSSLWKASRWSKHCQWETIHARWKM